MNGLPYYKAYPRDFFEGTIGMAFELKSAYRLLLDMIYMHNGQLPDDQRYIAGLLGCSVKKWNSLRAALIGAGKIAVSAGFIGNLRADKELEILGKFQDQQREKRARPNKTKGLQSPRLHHSESDTDTEYLTDVRHSGARDGDAVSSAVDIYNAGAGVAGWPKVQRVTPARRSAIMARMKEAGGIEGWKSAIEKAEKSDFLCGRSRAKFTASFDFLTRQSSFAKLMEGNYDNKSFGGGDFGAQAPDARNGDGNDAMLRGFQRYAAGLN